ncbi:MAG: hypothetical protein Q7S86_01935 [bacterium]|nr:hypothetical protein [bacterium]
MNDLAEGTLQVIDHENDIGESAIMDVTVAPSDYRLPVLQRHCRLRLRVKQIACGPIDDAIDTPEPHATRVDGRDKGIGFRSGNVARYNRNLTHLDPPFSLLSLELLGKTAPCHLPETSYSLAIFQEKVKRTWQNLFRFDCPDSLQQNNRVDCGYF